MKSKILAWILSASMLLSVSPMQVFAEDTNATDPNASSTSQTADQDGADKDGDGTDKTGDETGKTDPVETETDKPVCSCELLCTEENINSDCVVCGAESAPPLAMATLSAGAPAIIDSQETLQDAINDATDYLTITIGGNITVTSPIEIPNDKDITLDLNEKTISGSINDMITNNGTLTITGTGGTVSATTGYAILNNGILNVSGAAKVSATGDKGDAIGNSNSRTVTISDTATVSATTGYAIDNYGILNVSGGEVSATTGKAIYNYDTGTVTVSDTAKVSATGDNGKAIYNRSNTGKVTVSGGEVSATGDIGYAIYNNEAGTVTVSGAAKVSATGDNGRAIYNRNKGEVTVSGGTISATGDNGLAIYNYSGTLTVSGGTISATGTEGKAINNKDTVEVSDGTISATTGRAIYNNNKGEVTVSDTATVSATTGTAIENYSILTVSGGKVSATGEGGNAIYNNSGTVEVTGGEVSATGDNGYAIYNRINRILTISGTAKVSATGDNGWAIYNNGTLNLNGGSVNKIALLKTAYTATYPTITLGSGFSSETKPEITLFNEDSEQTFAPNSDKFTVITGTGIDSTDLAKFTCGNDNAEHVFENNTIVMQYKAPPVVKIGAKGYASLERAIADVGDNTATTIEIVADITVTSTIEIPDGKNITLDLNEKKISGSNGTVITNNGTLTITGTDGEVSATGEDGKAIENNGTLTVSGGEVSATGAYGWAIDNRSNCEVTISGTATVSATGAGGKAIANCGTLNVSGGTVSAAVEDVIAIFNYNAGTVTVSGTAKVSATTGSAIDNNYSGIVTVSDTAKVSATTGSAIDNEGALTISGGEVSATGAYGWAIYNSNTGTVTVSGTAKVSATGAGGRAINNNGGNATVTISDKAKVSATTGTAIYNNNSGTVTISDTAKVSATGDDGKAIYNGTNCEVTISGGEVSATTGKAIDNDGTVNVTNGTISATGDNGYAIFNATDCEVTISGTATVSATGDNGYAIYNNGTLNLNGGSVNKIALVKTGATYPTITLGDSFSSETKPEITLINGNSKETFALDSDNFIVIIGDDIDSTDLAKFTCGNDKTDLAINEDGKIVMKYAPTVVKIGDKEYPSLERAIAAVENDAVLSTTIKIVANITVTSTIEIPNGKNITIDLNGNTISRSSGSVIINRGTLTITGTDGTVSATGEDGIAIENHGTLNVSDGEVSATGANGWAIYNNGTGTVEVTGGTVSATTGKAIKNSGTLNVTGGTISATQTGGEAINNNETGIVTVSGGEVSATGDNGYAIYNKGTVEVSDGTIFAKTGKAIENYGILTVSGGEVSATTGKAIFNDGTLNVTGGTISATEANGKAIDNYGTLNVSGAAKVSATTGRAIYNDGENATVTISDTAEVSATTGRAIDNEGENATVTISDTAKVSATGDGGYAIDNKGTLNVTNGTVSATTGTAIFNNATGTVTVSGRAEVTTTTGNAIYNYGENATVTISDTAKVSATTGNAIYNNDENATVTISDTAKVSATTGKAIFNNSGTVEVSGGEVSATEYGGYAIYNFGTVEVDGGTISATTGTAIGNYGTLTVTGTAEVSATTGIAIDNEGGLNVSGGTISATGANGYAIENKDTGTVIVTGSFEIVGSITGTGTFETTIFTADGITVDELTYTGITLTPEITIANKTISGQEFTIVMDGWDQSFEKKDGDNWTTPTEIKNAGTYRVKYTKEDETDVTKEFTVNPKEITIETATATGRAYEKDNKNVDVLVTFNDAVNGDTPTYTAVGIMADDKAGENKNVNVTVTLTDKNYTLSDTEKTTTVTINKSTPAIEIKTLTAKTYDGTTFTPAESDMTITGADYDDVTFEYYADNEDEKGDKLDTAPTGVGTYWVVAKIAETINTASVESAAASFEITKADADLTAPTKIDGLAYTGLAQALVTAGSTDDGTINYSLDESAEKTWSETVPTGTNAGDYTVYYKVVGDENHEDTTAESLTVRINKATPVYTVPTGLTATYGQTLADVTLPDDFAFESADTTSVGNAGDRTFKVTFTPTDTDNYNVVTGIDVTVAVAKAEPSYEAPTGLTAIYGDTLVDVTLPDGFAFESGTGTLVGNAGDRTFKVTFTPTDTDNYNVVTGIDVTVAVAKAEPSYEAPTGLTAIYGDTLADVTLPDGFTFESGTGTSVGNAGDRTFKVTFTPTDTDNYNVVTDIDVTIAVAKATPTGKPEFDAIEEAEKTLGDANLKVGTITPVGTIEWDLGNAETVERGEKYAWTFIPDDKANYNEITGEIIVWANPQDDTQTIQPNVDLNLGSNIEPSENVEISAETSLDGTAKTEINEFTMDYIVKEIEQNSDEENPPQISLEVKSEEETDSVSIELPTSSIEDFVENEDAVLEIKTAIGTVKFDRKALAEIVEKSDDTFEIIIAKSDKNELTAKQKEAVGDSLVLDLSVISNGNVISNFAGGKAIVSVPFKLEKGVGKNTLIVYFVDANGNLEQKNTIFKDSEIIFMTEHFSTYIVKNVELPEIADVDLHFAEDEIKFAVSRGILALDEDGNFGPNDKITRAEFVNALGKLTGIDTTKYGKEDFNDLPISREEMAILLVKVANDIGFELPDVRKYEVFNDYNLYSENAKQSIISLKEAGILEGKENYNFEPKAALTKAETALTLSRFMTAILGETSETGWVKIDDGNYRFYADGKALKGNEKYVDGVSYNFNFYGITNEYFYKNVKTYVAKGETLYDISKKTGVDLRILVALNGEKALRYRYFGNEILLPR